MPNVRVAIVHPETKQPCAITDLGEVKRSYKFQYKLVIVVEDKGRYNYPTSVLRYQ